MLNRYQEALADLDRALALDAKDDWAMGARGGIYRQVGRYDEALADFDRALALDEKDSWDLAHRGATYRLMKRYEEALADFDRAIALDEKYSWALANRGETYRLMKRYQEALADLDRAIALDEESDWDWYSRALIRLCAGQMDAFHQDIQKATSLAEAKVLKNPDDHWSGFHLALYMLHRARVRKQKPFIAVLFRYVQHQQRFGMLLMTSRICSRCNLQHRLHNRFWVSCRLG